MITGPLFEEMLHPNKIDPTIRARALKAKVENPLDPINLFNITWRDSENHVNHIVLPKELTGVDANIVVLFGKDYPSGSHKVGAAYSVLLEKVLFGEVDPAVHTLVWPSTGNYGIGGAWVGGRMGCKSIVVLPEGMSRERFEKIRSYGAEVIATHGTESNVKEIYDETHRLAKDPNIRILNQFEQMGNYRYHYHVTGNTIVELLAELQGKGIGNGKAAAFVWAMGSGGTNAAADRLKQVYPDCKHVALEPIQCPTLFNNGYGSHEIQGIGDKHATWIHNVNNTDALMCIDDMSCVRGLQLLSEPVGRETLVKRYGADEALVERMAPIFGISGVCHILGSIKTAKYYGLGKDDVVVTAATDGFDRYPSEMDKLRSREGALDEARAVGRIEGVFHGQKTDWVQDGTRHNHDRWHNLKYYTWVEQQGKTVQELDAQRDPAWWEKHQTRVADIDAKLVEWRRSMGYPNNA
ncbi:MAG: pyridoxal-phosphate dependent enzyme [Anaerolineae bacterium]